MRTIIKRNDSKGKCKSNTSSVNILHQDQMNEVKEEAEEEDKVNQNTDHNDQMVSAVNHVHLQVAAAATTTTTTSASKTCDIVMYNVTRLIQFFNDQHLMSPALTSLLSTACHGSSLSDASTITQTSCCNRRNDANDERKGTQSAGGERDTGPCNRDSSSSSSSRKYHFKCPHDINEASVSASETSVTDKRINASDTLHKKSMSQGDHCDNNLHKQPTAPSCSFSSFSSSSSSSSCNQSSRYSEKRKRQKLFNCKLLVHFISISFILTLTGINSFPETARVPRIYKYQSIKVPPSLTPLDKLTTLSFAFQETSLLSPVNKNYYSNNNNGLKSLVSSPLPPYSSTASSVSTANVTVNPQPDYCKVCRCLKRDSLWCKSTGDLTSIPQVKTEIERQAISEIIIESQPKLTQLTTASLSGYPNIEKMYVTCHLISCQVVDNYLLPLSLSISLSTSL